LTQLNYLGTNYLHGNAGCLATGPEIMGFIFILMLQTSQISVRVHHEAPVTRPILH